MSNVLKARACMRACLTFSVSRFQFGCARESAGCLIELLEEHEARPLPHVAFRPVWLELEACVGVCEGQNAVGKFEVGCAPVGGERRRKFAKQAEQPSSQARRR
jgi:hypothetical protein